MPDVPWIELEPELLNQPLPHEEISGVQVVVGSSPFDVPAAVRGYQHDVSKRFIIEFRYLGESERRIPQKIDRFVTLRIGENSKRLYEIRVNVDALQAETVNLTLVVNDAIQSYAEDKNNLRKQAISRMAGEVFRQKGPELMPAH